RIARGHAVERAVRLDVVEGHALGLEKAPEGTDLVDQAVGELLAPDLHLASPEALAVRQRGMGAGSDAMRLCQPHGGAHVVEVGGMEATGDVGDVDGRHDPLVVAHPPNAVAFAHVAIEQGHLALRRSRDVTVANPLDIVKSEIVVHRIEQSDTSALNARISSY